MIEFSGVADRGVRVLEGGCCGEGTVVEMPGVGLLVVMRVLMLTPGSAEQGLGFMSRVRD